MAQRKATRTVIPIREDGMFGEPTLEEILSDSIVAAVMKADDVDPAELHAMLNGIARALRGGSHAAAAARLRAWDQDTVRAG